MLSREAVAFDEIFDMLLTQPGNMETLIRRVQSNKYHASAALKSALILRLEHLVNWFLENRPDVFMTGPMLDYALQGGDLYLVELVHENFKKMEFQGFGLVTAIENEDFDSVEWLMLKRPTDFDPKFALIVAERCDEDLGFDDEARADVLLRIYEKFLRR